MRKIYLLICTVSLTILSNQLYTQVTNQPANTGVASVSQCGGTYNDAGGSLANYTNTENSFLTICPSIPGQYVTITFLTFNCENNFDYLMVFDGATANSAIVGIYTGTTIPPAITSSDPSGCLSFRFFADGTTNRPGWTSTVTCSVAPGPVPAASPQDCGGGQGITLCSDASFGGNSSGPGVVDELEFGNPGVPWQGCLVSGERQSSWYYFSPSASGTMEFVINPTNGTDDYDFAIWGPSGTDLPCPAFTGQAPIRCSYADGTITPTPATGLLAPNVDVSEGAGGNGFVAPLAIVAGQLYVMCIDNFTSSASPFTLDFTLSGGASLDCTPLPIVLESFNGLAKETSNKLFWTTSTEVNNDYFIVEKSEDAIHWTELGRVKGAGNSNEQRNYNLVDPIPFKTTYYKLSQTDYDGKKMEFKTIAVERNDNGSMVGDVFGFYPNPASDMINVQTYAEGENKLTIRDQTGKTVFYAIINGRTTQTVNFDNTVSNGLYFITIENEGSIQNEKIIIRK